MPMNNLNDPIVRQLTAPGQMLEMEEIDVRGVRLRAWKNAPPSLRAILDLSALHGDKDFIVYEDERWSFAQHYRAVASVADWLQSEAGVTKGDRVAIAMRNFPEWSIAFWAAASIGAIVVPLNSWWTGEELRYGLDDSQTKVLFCDIERFGRIEPHITGLTTLDNVVVAKSAAPAGMAGMMADFDLLLDRGVDAPPHVAIEPDDEATIFYTSGTTGNPKGALGTHRNITQNLFNLVWSARSRAAVAADPQTPPAQPQTPAAAPETPAQLLSVPFFHVTGCHSTLVPTLAAGTKLVLMYRWNPERALELIERERVTSFGGVPTMVWQVLESPDFPKRDTSSVAGIGYGGAPAPPELVRRIKEHFPTASPGNGYGLTEISSLAVGIGGKDYFERPDSVGRPMPIVDVKVVGEDGTELAPGEQGELWMRGPNVVKGYWNKPEPTAETFRDGWLVTGDVAEIDADGFVYIRDRAKDMVIRGGENVYSVEIEQVLFEHPDVSEAAVIGIPHVVLGEEVAAVVKRVPGSQVTEEQLKDHVSQRLAAYKVPVRIAITDEPLPRNAAGKVLKRELREQLVAASP
jgi:long-chain acyl-CoA synthetase